MPHNSQNEAVETGSSHLSGEFASANLATSVDLDWSDSFTEP